MSRALYWIYDLPISQAMRTTSGLSEAIHVIHLLSILFVILSISAVDLRLMGISQKHIPVTELLAMILPRTLGAFMAAAVTGMLMFMSEAPTFYNNEYFRLKILLIGLAGINMGVFHAFTYRGVARWDDGVPTVWAAKAAGGLSLALWIAVFVYGVKLSFAVKT